MCNHKIRGAKGILEYPLPEESRTFLMAIKGVNWASAMFDLNNDLVALTKWDNALLQDDKIADEVTNLIALALEHNEDVDGAEEIEDAVNDAVDIITARAVEIAREKLNEQIEAHDLDWGMLY